jgi:hypothetical protein
MGAGAAAITGLLLVWLCCCCRAAAGAARGLPPGSAARRADIAADGGAGVGPLAMMTGADAAGVMVMLTYTHIVWSTRSEPTLRSAPPLFVGAWPAVMNISTAIVHGSVQLQLGSCIHGELPASWQLRQLYR